MNTVPHIIVTTDFSKEAAVAFPFAIEQLRQAGAGAKLTLLAVLEDVVASTVTFEFGVALIDAEDMMKQAYESAVSKLKELARQSFTSVPELQTVVLRGKFPTHREIVHFGEVAGATMIVMATHGRSGVKHLLLGSVAEKVVREASCPVLVVPCKSAAA